MPPASKLTVEEIAVGALSLLDREGADALSMRRLAADLGVGTMTLYHYYPDKQALIGAALDLAVGPLTDLGTSDGLTGRARVKAVALGMYDALGAHPWVHHIRSDRLLGRHTTLALGETILTGLAEAGLEPPMAAATNILILDYISGAAAFPTMAELSDELREMEASLPADAFPTLRAASLLAVEALDSGLTRRHVVELNLDVILDGAGAARP